MHTWGCLVCSHLTSWRSGGTSLDDSVWVQKSASWDSSLSPESKRQHDIGEQALLGWTCGRSNATRAGCCTTYNGITPHGPIREEETRSTSHLVHTGLTYQAVWRLVWRSVWWPANPGLTPIWAILFNPIIKKEYGFRGRLPRWMSFFEPWRGLWPIKRPCWLADRLGLEPVHANWLNRSPWYLENSLTWPCWVAEFSSVSEWPFQSPRIIIAPCMIARKYYQHAIKLPSVILSYIVIAQREVWRELDPLVFRISGTSDRGSGIRFNMVEEKTVRWRNCFSSSTQMEIVHQIDTRFSKWEGLKLWPWSRPWFMKASIMKRPNQISTAGSLVRKFKHKTEFICRIPQDDVTYANNKR